MTEIQAFTHVTTFRLVYSDRRFEGAYFLLQAEEICNFCNLKKEMNAQNLHQTHYGTLKTPKTVDFVFLIFGKGKGKAIPLQPWTGPEGSRRLRHPDFKTIDT